MIPIMGTIPSDTETDPSIVSFVPPPRLHDEPQSTPITYIYPAPNCRVILNIQPSPRDSRDLSFMFPKKRMVGMNTTTDQPFVGDTALPLPENLDYTSQMMPIRNQGDLFGTCGPQVFCSMYEWEEKRGCDHLSPQFMFNCRATQNQNGMTCRDVMKIGQKIGVPKETEYPYGTQGDMVDIARDPLLMGNASRHIISSYSRADDIVSMKHALEENGPTMVAIPVYNLTDPNKLWVKDADHNALRGGHAVTLVGYDVDEVGPHFIVRNSWGTGWGVRGYGKLYETDWIHVWEGWTCEYKGHSSKPSTEPSPEPSPEPERTSCESIVDMLRECF